MQRNPKQEGSALFDCIPQEGKCPQGCNQCEFNRPGAFYCETPLVPTLDEILQCQRFDEETNGMPIVRMNCGHDSNINRGLVIKTAKQYPEVFFNTSIPNFDFPGPVVFTANPSEEREALFLHDTPVNLMFVRLRVSSTNLDRIARAVIHYNVPIVLTFMAYYEGPPEPVQTLTETENYTFMIRHVNDYWCPKESFIKDVMKLFKDTRTVHLCGKWCKDCRNCETFYLQTRNRLKYIIS